MALSAVAISCSSPQSDIEFRKGSSINPFLEYVSSVSLVPLETDSLHILGNNPELMISGTDFILTDAQNGSIYRYSPIGKGQKDHDPDQNAKARKISQKKHSGDLKENQDLHQ